MLKHGGVRKLGGRGQVLGGPVVGCLFLGGPVGVYLRLSGQRGSEENLEALLDDHPEGMQLLDDKLTKQKLAPVLLVRWSPKVRGHLSQCADGKNLALFVDGLAIPAGGNIVPGPGQHRRSGSKGGGDGLGHGIQFRKIGGGTRLVRGHIAGVSVVPGAGFVATINATASSLAALAEL